MCIRDSEINRDGTGSVQSVEERRTALSRTRVAAQDRSLQTDREQVLVANPDQVVFVFSVANPAFSARKLDRFLVVAEMNPVSYTHLDVYKRQV